jgi:hypothetical protein
VGAAHRLGRAGRLRWQRGQPGAGPNPVREDDGDLPRWAHCAADSRCGLPEEPPPEGGQGGLTGGLGVAGAGRGPIPHNFAGHGGVPAAGDACAVTGCGLSYAASRLTRGRLDGDRNVLRRLSARAGPAWQRGARPRCGSR